MTSEINVFNVKLSLVVLIFCESKVTNKQTEDPSCDNVMEQNQGDDILPFLRKSFVLFLLYLAFSKV